MHLLLLSSVQEVNVDNETLAVSPLSSGFKSKEDCPKDVLIQRAMYTVCGITSPLFKANLSPLIKAKLTFKAVMSHSCHKDDQYAQ